MNHYDNRRSDVAVFMWRVSATHTIAYFIAGICAMVFMRYREQFAADIMAVIMRPLDSPWVAAGAGLQLIRGILIALVLLPFKQILLEKKGYFKLAGLVLGLSYLSTLGPCFGSFEGYVFTSIPLEYHLLGIPESLVYVFLFSTTFFLWYKKPRKIWNIVSLVLVIIIVLMSLLGVLSSLGILGQ